ncbi:hypothetical protein QQ045_010384 [Rhodiola kirilowii]
MVKYGKTESCTEERSLGSSASSSHSSSSSSDSEYYSPEEIVGKNAKHHKVRRSPKMMKYSKVNKMRMSDVGDSASTSTENNVIAEYNAAIEKNQQLETLVSDLNQEKRKMLQTFIDEMKDMFGDRKNLLGTSAEEVDFYTLVTEVKKEAMTVKFQLDSTDNESQEMKEYIHEHKGNVTRLENENGGLRARIDELENLPRQLEDENGVLRARIDELENLSRRLKDENAVLRARIDELENLPQRLEDQNDVLRARIDELENLPRPHCDTDVVNEEGTKALQSRQEEMVAQVKNLQHQNKKLEEEIISSKEEIHVSESRIDELAREVSDLENRNKEERHVLESKIDELVGELGDLENRNKELMEKIKLHEESNDATYILESRIEEQVSRVTDLQNQNKKLEEEIVLSRSEKESLMDQMAAMQQEMESLNRKKRELIEQINTIQVEILNDEKSRSQEDEKRVMESHAMIKNLEIQIDSSNKQKSVMEVALKETSEENCQLKEKMKELEKKIYDLERNLVQRGDRVSDLEREASELSTKLSLRDEEFTSLQSQKAQLEQKIARGREEEATGLKNNSLAKEREDKLNNGISNKEFEKIKGWFKGSKPSLQVIERKMEELVEEFRKHMEDNIRLMSQRIRVTEQLHVENKESYKITKERLEQENIILEARTSEYSRMLSNFDSATTRLKNVAEATHNMLSGLDLVGKQFNEKSVRMMNRMSKFSEELRYVKNWVIGTKKVNELLKGEMGGLVEQLQRKEENESLLREKISMFLESKVENISLLKALEQVEQKMEGLQAMVREKENGILDICEEKREAIRQLCVLIDYQKNRSDHFRQIIIQKQTVISPRKC